MTGENVNTDNSSEILRHLRSYFFLFLKPQVGEFLVAKYQTSSLCAHERKLIKPFFGEIGLFMVSWYSERNTFNRLQFELLVVQSRNGG